MAEWRLLISCEHGGNQVPVAYQSLLAGHDALLASHRGWDPGALELARMAAERFGAPLMAATTTRLLVDLNRSRGNRALFSEISRRLGSEERERLMAEHYEPHRQRLVGAVRREINGGAGVVHLACHTFTPVLAGRVRTMDVGLLYDPRRDGERRLCRIWQQEIVRSSSWVVRRNAPYRGVTDCLASELRALFPRRYLGIELELNHREFLEERERWNQLCEAVLDGFEVAWRRYFLNSTN